jgi:hypothetical protein
MVVWLFVIASTQYKAVVEEASEFSNISETQLTLSTMAFLSSGNFTSTNGVSFESSQKSNSIQRLSVSGLFGERASQTLCYITTRMMLGNIKKHRHREDWTACDALW